MERREDRSKALSYIGIEIADALKVIPKPVEEIEETKVEEIAPVQVEEKPKAKAKAKTKATAKKEKVEEMPQVAAIEENKVEEDKKAEIQEIEEYQESITFDKKPSLWQRFKNSKLARAVTYVFRIRIRIELPNALPEGRGEN